MKNIFETKNLNRQDNNNPHLGLELLFHYLKKITTSYLYINITDTILHLLRKY